MPLVSDRLYLRYTSYRIVINYFTWEETRERRHFAQKNPSIPPPQKKENQENYKET